MSTTIKQTPKLPVKIEAINTSRGTEIGISQQISVNQFAEIRVSLDALPEVIVALTSELEFLRPTAKLTRPAVDPNQGQLFNPDDF